MVNHRGMLGIVTNVACLHKKVAPAFPGVDYQREVSSMFTYLLTHKSLGLAANQLGFDVRLVLIPIRGAMTPLFNPEVVAHSDDRDISYEACLSIPGKVSRVRRFSRVTLRAIAKRGLNVEFTLVGPEAWVAQHEVDHLDGILMTDREREVNFDGRLDKSFGTKP